MAKTKKSGGEKHPAGKKAATTEKSAPQARPPSIDTTLAAATAAAMVGNKVKPAEPANADSGKKESSTFRQMKDSLTKTPGQIMGDVLHQTGGGKKSSLPFGGGKQVGHNQTFSDATRRNVPRRTGGG